MIYPRVHSPFSCIGHRGGFGSLQRLVKEYAPVRWVPPEEAQIGFFWHDGLLQPAELAAFRGPKVLYVAGSYARAQALPESSQVKMNAQSVALAEIADGICHVSNAQRDFFLRFLGPGLSGKPFHIFPPTFDSAIFYPASTPPDEPVIVATALWRDWFRWLTVLEGFAAFLRRAPSARLILAGGWIDEGLRTVQRQVASELGIEGRLSFRQATGATYRDEDAVIADALREGTVFVHARYADWGTLTGVEAIACGLPVVCGDNGGLPELLGDSAITLPYRSALDSPILGILNPEELADAMWRAHDERIARRPACIERAKRFEVRTVLANLVGWLGSFIA